MLIARWPHQPNGHALSFVFGKGAQRTKRGKEPLKGSSSIVVRGSGERDTLEKTKARLNGPWGLGFCRVLLATVYQALDIATSDTDVLQCCIVELGKIPVCLAELKEFSDPVADFHIISPCALHNYIAHCFVNEHFENRI
nr:hypothetical protein [Rhizobium mesoamericanum]